MIGYECEIEKREYFNVEVQTKHGLAEALCSRKK
jgi:hypothetical protein